MLRFSFVTSRYSVEISHCVKLLLCGEYLWWHGYLYFMLVSIYVLVLSLPISCLRPQKRARILLQCCFECCRCSMRWCACCVRWVTLMWHLGRTSCCRSCETFHRWLWSILMIKLFPFCVAKCQRRTVVSVASASVLFPWVLRWRQPVSTKHNTQPFCVQIDYCE